jgi:uroporphyrinogen decarboxylase
VDGIGVDTSADLGAVARLVPAHVATQGNLDPMALVAGGAALSCETERVLAAARGRPHVFNLGHGIVPETPPEHVSALLAQIRAA